MKVIYVILNYQAIHDVEIVYKIIYMDQKEIDKYKDELVLWADKDVFSRDYKASNEFVNIDGMRSYFNSFTSGRLKSYYLWEISGEGIEDIFEEIESIELMREII